MTSKTELIIDTDILIDAGRRIQVAIDYLQVKEQYYTLTISSITHLELLVGGRNTTEQRKNRTVSPPISHYQDQRNDHGYCG